MRSDMDKVLLGRERRGRHGFSCGKNYANLRLRRSNPEEEDSANGGSMKPRGFRHRVRHRKHPEKNYNPLEKFLLSRVGKPWSKVYSELRAQTDFASNGLLGRDLLSQFVATVVVERDGVLIVCDGRGEHSLAETQYTVAVHPKTGNLVPGPAAVKGERANHNPKAIQVRGPLPSAGAEYLCMGHVWYKVTMGKNPVKEGYACPLGNGVVELMYWNWLGARGDFPQKRELCLCVGGRWYHDYPVLQVLSAERVEDGALQRALTKRLQAEERAERDRETERREKAIQEALTKGRQSKEASRAESPIFGGIIVS